MANNRGESEREFCVWPVGSVSPPPSFFVPQLLVPNFGGGSGRSATVEFSVSASLSPVSVATYTTQGRYNFKSLFCYIRIVTMCT